MSKIKYTDAPTDVAEAIESSRKIKDFLPPPDELARIMDKEKSIVNIDSHILNAV